MICIRFETRRMAANMPTLTEVPNSQPSSPALSPTGIQEGEQDTEALRTINDAIQLGKNLQEPRVSESSEPPRRGELEEGRQAKSSKSQRSPVPTGVEFTSPGKSATVSDNGLAIRRDIASPRPKAEMATPSRRPGPKNTTTTRNPAYLRSRIAQLTTTTASTHSDLNATLSKLQALLPPGSDTPPKVISSPCSTSSLPSAVPLNLDSEQKHILSQAQRTLDAHVKMLSKYNAVKDVGMTMLGILAEQKGVTVRAIMEERGVSEDD